MKSRFNRLKPGTSCQGRSSPRSGTAGFAMMEALMAAAMLGIVVVGTLQFFTFGQSRISELAIDRAAFDVARSEVEKNIARGHDNVVAGFDTTQFLFDDRIYITTTVTTIDDETDSLGASDSSGPADYKKVSVSVSYLEQSKTANMSTLITPTN